MKPIGPLMHEHRLIERMLSVIKAEVLRIKGGETAEPYLIGQTIDFFRTYADRCHHGKEEDILFRELKNREISDSHRTMMEELIREHVEGRSLVSDLDESYRQLLRTGDETASQVVASNLNRLLSFYPRHIKKEDKDFFHPVMEYFSQDEMNDMLKEFENFEKELLHNKYSEMMQGWEKKF